jgi:hypothetical protein
MKKYEKDYFKQMDGLISTYFITEEDHMKLEFSKHFLKKLQLIDMDGVKIQMEPVDVKLFQYFVLSILLEWESKNRKVED